MAKYRVSFRSPSSPRITVEAESFHINSVGGSGKSLLRMYAAESKPQDTRSGKREVLVVPLEELQYLHELKS